MRRLLKWLFGLFVVVLLLAGALFLHVWYFKPAKIEWFYSRVFMQYVLDDPTLFVVPFEQLPFPLYDPPPLARVGFELPETHLLGVPRHTR